MNISSLGTILGVGLLSTLKSKKGNQNKKFVYTGINCSEAAPNVVDWSIGSWEFPTPTHEIEWKDFIENVEVIPSQIDDYIPNSTYTEVPKPNALYDWETIPMEQYIGDPARIPEHHEDFYKTTLPSGKVFYVWQFGGVEHWFSEDGELNVESEGLMMDKISSILSDIEEKRWEADNGTDISLEDTLRIIEQVVGS